MDTIILDPELSCIKQIFHLSSWFGFGSAGAVEHERHQLRTDELMSQPCGTEKNAKWQRLTWLHPQRVLMQADLLHLVDQRAMALKL